MQNSHLGKPTPDRRATCSRRNVLAMGTVAGVLGVSGISAIAQRVDAAPKGARNNDAAVLNKALYYEQQAIWAYSFAAGKLTNTEVGQAVLALALRNQADHKQHRDALAAAVQSLGGKPIQAQSNYDVSAYVKQGEGNLDSDVNIAKLALALEVDAAIAYVQAISMLKTPALISAGASIGTVESAHAAAIRATFKSLGIDLAIVPTSFINADARKAWILQV